MKLPPIPPEMEDGIPMTNAYGDEHFILTWHDWAHINDVIPRKYIADLAAAEWRKAGIEERAREWEVWGGWTQ